MAEAWLAAREAELDTPGGIRPVTLAGYRSALYALLGQLGDRVARDVTPDDIEAALRVMATNGGRGGRPLSHRTLTYGLVSLRQIYKYAIRQRWLTEDPATVAKAPGRVNDAATSPVKRWSVEELKTFRACVDQQGENPTDPWIRAGMRLSLCGLRRSEVLGLDWAKVNLDAGTVRIEASRTKTGRGNATAIGGPKTDRSRRTVAVEMLHPGTANALRTLWMTQGRPSFGLVVQDNAGQPVHPDAFSRRFKALCGAAEVRYPGSIHRIRHALGTMLRLAGVPDTQSAALLGHDLQTFLRFYVLADDDDAALAAAAAGRLLADG